MMTVVVLLLALALFASPVYAAPADPDFEAKFKTFCQNSIVESGEYDPNKGKLRFNIKSKDPYDFKADKLTLIKFNDAVLPDLSPAAPNCTFLSPGFSTCIFNISQLKFSQFLQDKIGINTKNPDLKFLDNIKIDYSIQVQKPNTTERHDCFRVQSQQSVQARIQINPQPPNQPAAPPAGGANAVNAAAVNTPCNPNDPNFGPCPAGLAEFEQMVGSIISVVVGLGFIAMLVLVVMAGFKYLTSGGEPKAIQSAHQTLTWAILGVFFMAVAWLILQLIHSFTGIDVTIFDIKTLCGGIDLPFCK